MARSPSSAAALNSRSRSIRRVNRKPDRRSIKLHRSYTVDEASRTIGSAKGTIRRWIKSGALPALTDQKPNLILGEDLIDYLKARAKPGPKMELTNVIASGVARLARQLSGWSTTCLSRARRAI